MVFRFMCALIRSEFFQEFGCVFWKNLNTPCCKEHEDGTCVNTVKFLNFGTPEIFAVIYLKFKQRGQTLKGILSKWCKWNSKQ